MTESPFILPTPGPVPDRDRETARLLMAGDPEGVRRLLVDYGGKVLGLLRKEFANVLDMHEVEDAASQASLRAWRSGNRYDAARGTLGSWLYVIARNCARRMLDAKRRRASVAYVDDVDSAAAASTAVAPYFDAPLADPALSDPFLLDVRACIQELAPQQRAVLLADLAAGGTAPTEMLAEQLQTSRNSIYVSRNNGRKALRVAMLKRGHTFDYDNAKSLGGWT